MEYYNLKKILLYFCNVGFQPDYSCQKNKDRSHEPMPSPHYQQRHYPFFEGPLTPALDDNGFARIWKYLADDNGSLDYYFKNSDEIAIIAKFGDDESVNELIEHYNKVISIRDVLPLEYYDRSDPDNSIGVFVEEDMNECDNKILCLVIYGGEDNRDIALSLIKEAGYNPDDYGIRFEED